MEYEYGASSYSQHKSSIQRFVALSIEWGEPLLLRTLVIKFINSSGIQPNSDYNTLVIKFTNFPGVQPNPRLLTLVIKFTNSSTGY